MINNILKKANLFLKLASIPELEDLIKNPDKAYKIFDIARGVGLNKVKSKYKELVLKNHPDKGTSPEEKEALTKKIIIINKAFDILKKIESNIQDETTNLGFEFDSREDPVDAYLNRLDNQGELIDDSGYMDWTSEVELDENYSYQSAINEILKQNNIKPNSPEAKEFIKTISPGDLERQRIKDFEKIHSGIVGKIKGERYVKTKIITLQKFFDEINLEELIKVVRKLQQEILKIKDFTYNYSGQEVPFPFGELLYKLYYDKFDQFPLKFIKDKLNTMNSAYDLIYSQDKNMFYGNNPKEASVRLYNYLQSNDLFTFKKIIKELLEFVNEMEEDTGDSFNKLKNSINELNQSFNDFINRYNKFYAYLLDCQNKEFIGLLK